MNNGVDEAIKHLETFGYCVLPDRIPGDLARQMAERFVELVDDPQHAAAITGDEHYQTLFGMLNLDDRVWTCASHPDVLAVARHFLGAHCRVVEAACKPTRPVDSANAFARVPDVPWMINTIWMLSDFTIENGATGVVPMSHTSRIHRPPPEIDREGPLIKPVTGRAGSVMMWHAGLFHMARANTRDQIRVGLNLSCYPRHFKFFQFDRRSNGCRLVRRN